MPQCGDTCLAHHKRFLIIFVYLALVVGSPARIMYVARPYSCKQSSNVYRLGAPSPKAKVGSNSSRLLKGVHEAKVLYEVPKLLLLFWWNLREFGLQAGKLHLDCWPLRSALKWSHTKAAFNHAFGSGNGARGLSIRFVRRKLRSLRKLFPELSRLG